MKKRTLIRTLSIAALAAAASAGLAAAQAPTDARVAELLAQAKTQAEQAPQQAAGAPAAPRPVQNLTMDEAVAKALDQNIDLSVERLNPQLQDLSLQQVRAAYAPTVTSTLGRRSNTTQPGNIFGGGDLVDTGTYTYNAGVSQALHLTGGTVTLNFNNSRQKSSNTAGTIDPRYDSSLTAQLTQPLLRNRSIDANRQSLLTAEITRRLSDVTLRGTTINTVANTKNAYWDLVYAVQAVDAARTSLALAEKLVQDNQARVEIGTMAPIDVVTAQSEAASRRLALVQAEANQRTAELALKRLMVSGTTDPLWNATLNPTDRPDAGAGEKIDLEGALKKALTERTDLVQAREQLRSNDISLRYLKNQRLPDLNMVASYGASGTGGNYWNARVQPRELIDAGGYSDAIDLLTRRKLPNWNVQLQFSYPIGTSAQEASYARALVQLKQTQAQVRSLELRVATELTNSALTVQNTYQQVQASSASRELAQKKLEAEQSKFDVGMSTNFAVVQAQRDLADAKNAELRAILNYRKALVDFQRLQETSSSGTSGVSAVSTAAR